MSETIRVAGMSPDEMKEAIAGLSTQDTIESPFGQLDFFDGVPRPSTVTRLYDALDLMRGIEAFLNAMPGASLVAMRKGLVPQASPRPDHRHHRAARQLGQPLPHAEHRDHLRDDVLRSPRRRGRP